MMPMTKIFMALLLSLAGAQLGLCKRQEAHRQCHCHHHHHPLQLLLMRTRLVSPGPSPSRLLLPTWGGPVSFFFFGSIAWGL